MRGFVGVTCLVLLASIEPDPRAPLWVDAVIYGVLLLGMAWAILPQIREDMRCR